MKRIFIALFAATLGFSVLVGDAQARRLGGGSSFGMNRSSPAMRQAAPAPAPKPPTQSAAPTAATPQPPVPQPSGMSRWLGPIAGLAAGIGLASLFSHFGLGEGMGNMVMILLLVMAAVFVVRLFLNRRQPAGNMQYAGAAPQRLEPVAMPAGSGTPSAAPFAPNVPAGFDTEGFLRQAKLNFIRLQAANDSGDMADLKQFTAPEVFAEVQMQYEERGRAKQQTDVVQLSAELLDIVDEDKRHVASVRFHGQLRETPNAAPEDFSEVWHLVKPIDGSGGWLVAGIQQVQ
jgi:predicted lipid-binding transport protein (Tim44 family)